MMGAKMAVFDLDGTLLTHGALTHKAIRMLKTLRQNGIRVVIATGRHRGTVPLRLQSPRLADYLICTCGAVVASAKGETLLESTLSREELQRLMELGAPFGCRYALSAGRSTFLSRREPLLRRKTDGGSDTKKFFWRYYMYPLHSRTTASWRAFLQRPDARAEKVVCTPADPAQEMAFRQAVALDGRFEATGADGAAEITKKGVSKGSALGFLAQRLGIPKDAIVAFGNDDNDLSLGDYAGRFVAARDSSPAALAAADQVADDIADAALRLCVPENGRKCP